jgi:hypothetical protein
MATKSQFAEAANSHSLLIAEHDGDVMGIGERDELQALIADGILPEGTTLREATPSDF